MNLILSLTETVIGAIFAVSAMTGSEFTWGPFNPRVDYEYPYKMPTVVGRILFGAIGVVLLVIGIRNLLRLT